METDTMSDRAWKSLARKHGAKDPKSLLQSLYTEHGNMKAVGAYLGRTEKCIASAFKIYYPDRPKKITWFDRAKRFGAKDPADLFELLIGEHAITDAEKLMTMLDVDRITLQRGLRRYARHYVEVGHLPKPEQPKTKPVNLSPRPKKQQSGRICRKCGRSIDNENRFFCSYCFHQINRDGMDVDVYSIPGHNQSVRYF